MFTNVINNVLLNIALNPSLKLLFILNIVKC